MRNHFKLFFSSYIFLFVLFMVHRLVFLMFNWSLLDSVSVGEILLSFLHGLKLDSAFSGMVMLIAGMIMVIAIILRAEQVKKVWLVYFGIVICLTWGLCIADAELYTYWQLKLDKKALSYLSNPEGVFMSVSIWRVILNLLLIIAASYGSIRLFKYKIVARYKLHDAKYNWKGASLFLLLSGSMILPARGGFDLHPLQVGLPISISSAYFSNTAVLNHAAYNVPWYLISTLKGGKDKLFNYYEEEAVDQVYQSIYGERQVMNPKEWVDTAKPNIIILVLESFTSNLIEPLGGRKGVTPHLNKLANEGVLFTRFYATGVRSEMGLVSIFSGAPSLPHKSLMKEPRMFGQLDYLFEKLNQLGYHTGFYYGGDMNFCNFQAYFSEAGVNTIVSKSDFKSEHYTSSWGVPDHLVLERLSSDLARLKQPFCHGLFTLNSHTPFDVPMETVIKGDDDDSKFMNSAYYTDKSIGSFVASLKKNGVWDNTLLFITADHSCNYLSDAPRSSPEKFHIPLIISGGALIKRGERIDQVASQTDVSPSILSLVGHVDEGEFPFGRTFFVERSGAAFYTYGEGVGFVNDTLVEVYDINGDRFDRAEKFNPAKDRSTAKALLQKSSKMFSFE